MGVAALVTRLSDLADLATDAVETGAGMPAFLDDQRVRALRWPIDVVEQWLYDHAPTRTFEADYGHIDLEGIEWSVQVISATTLAKVPTGAHDQGCIEQYAEDPEHWVNVRNVGFHLGVRDRPSHGGRSRRAAGGGRTHPHGRAQRAVGVRAAGRGSSPLLGGSSRRGAAREWVADCSGSA